MLIASIKHNYEWQLSQYDMSSVVGMAVREMKTRPDLDTWYNKVKNNKGVMNIRDMRGSKESVSKCLKSCFDRFWLDQGIQDKVDLNSNDRNKLQFYKTLKCTFSPEFYVLNVPNRSQRAWLTRFRISDVSKLRVEGGRLGDIPSLSHL